MGFDYVIAYTRGVDNRVADALSRQFKGEASIAGMSALQTSWMAEIQHSWEGDTLVQQLITKLIAGSGEMVDYSYVNGMLRYKGKLYVGSHGDLRSKIIHELHHNGVGGHYGMRGTMKRIAQFFFWLTLSRDVIVAVQSCLICQRSKS